MVGVARALSVSALERGSYLTTLAAVEVETGERVDKGHRDLQRKVAVAEHAAREARAQTLEVRQRLLAVETELARARQAAARHAGDLSDAEARVKELEAELEAANRTIREMQATRVWRFGTRFWRLRDRLRGRD